ncbi:MAG: [LysW]-aminoadipate kinase [bacterium]
MLIIKIGGGDTINLKGIVEDLAELKEPFIIVHGANAVRDKLAEQLGSPKKVLTSVSGYSSVFSDETTIDILMMAYAGLRNKRIVELCQQNGINAVGLSGIDGKVVQGQRNRGIRVREEGKLKIVRDFSGKPKGINKGLIELLLKNNYVPVLCVPILDENNFAINSENDDIVAVLQSTLHADKIIHLIESPGFLENKDDPNTLIKHIPKDELKLREKQVEGRMKRKMLALRKLFENQATVVIISDGRTQHPVNDALNGKGTIIQ